MSPRNLAMAASMSESFSPAAPTAVMTSPSASSVTVEMPRRMVAEYALSDSAKYPSSRVAFPIPMIKTPVAIGSSVPAWPTLRVPSSRRIRPTTWWEVQPAGLSQMTRPDSAGLLVIFVLVRVGVARVGGLGRLLGDPGVRRVRSGQQVVDLPRVLRHRVEHEGDRRRELHPELLPDMAADQPRRGGQSRGRPGVVGIRP